MSRQFLHPICALPRKPFARTALFTAVTSSLFGLGMVTAVAANTDSNVNSNVNNSADSDANNISSMTDSDTELEAALNALHLKKAVEQGIIDQSVLDEYNKQNFNQPNNNDGLDSDINSDANGEIDTITDTQSNMSNESLYQQAASVQQQGYQMMTPEQIDRELASIDFQNQSDDNSDSSSNDKSMGGFDLPIATLNTNAPLIGLDVDLDASSLPTPNNLETLGREPEESAAERAETAEIMARPINVSDSVSSGRVEDIDDILQQSNAEQALAQQERQSTTETLPAEIDEEKIKGGLLDPDDYLPDYQAATDTVAVNESIVQASKPKPRARNNGNLVKRLYNRFFNGGYMALPHVETTVYLQQKAASDDDTANTPVKLIKADEDTQPINNIKAALDDTTVQSVADFTAALPRLRQIALDAAKAVGYYDITLRFRQPNSDSIDVIIEKLGEPVRVDSRIVDIRGAGMEQAEFKALEKDLPPQEGDIFNHRVYKNSKAALESLSNTYGYFDQYWLNKSVDVILPDNTADIALVYNTGDRYSFDEVVFFTYDKESNTLTRDPDKLPVDMSVLQQLYDFKAGDPFYQPAITKFSNDLSATRYFNTVNVESILPPDERSEGSSLAFDNSTSNSEADRIGADGNDNNDVAGTSASVSSSNNNNDTSNDIENGDTVNADSEVNASSGANDDSNDIAPIEFEVDEETSDKLQAIKQKSDRLSRLPTDRVLDEKSQETDSLLGKISDSISKVAKKIFPDEERLTADENFIPPTLEGRKTPEQVQENKKVPLYVFVSSDKPRDAQVGIGYGTDTGVRATGKIDYNLINRKGYQAGTEVEVSRINKNATVYGSRPWKHPLNDKLEARLTYKEETIDQGEGNFDLSTKTLKAALARNIHREKGWDRSYFMRYRLDELETGVDVADLDKLPVRFVSSKPQQQALLFGYGMSKSTVDSVTNPTRGFRQYYSVEAGANKVLSDTDMAIINAGVSGLYSFGEDKKHQVLGRFNTGYIWADEFEEVPYKLRFFAGGDQSLRGYDYNSLSPLENGYLTGGKILAVGSAEYNYEFKPGFRGALFTDIGNAYDEKFETDTKVGVGVGIRWASPVGVVRVDVAAGVTESDIPVRLHFFIGSPL